MCRRRLLVSVWGRVECRGILQEERRGLRMERLFVPEVWQTAMLDMSAFGDIVRRHVLRLAEIRLMAVGMKHLDVQGVVRLILEPVSGPPG